MINNQLKTTYSIRGVQYALDQTTGHLVDANSIDNYELRRIDLPGCSNILFYGIGDIREEVQAKSGDIITIVSFDCGGLFLIFNHNRRSYKYYPRAVYGLAHSLGKKRRGFTNWVLNTFAINREADGFNSSPTFNSILKEVELLSAGYVPR